MKEKLFSKKLFSLDIEEIKELGEKYVEIQNVINGYHMKAIHLRGGNYNFELVYIAENPELKNIEGYELQYKFESQNHADIILTYCSFIVEKFPFENLVRLYNTYIDQMRSIFSQEGIEVVTQADIDQIRSKYGRGGTIAVKSPCVYLRTFTEKELYRELFSFDYSSFVVEDDKKYVYLIYSQSNGYFKIGYSKNPIKREQTLQAEEPDISLLKIWEGDRALEKSLHQKYSHLRVRGEWFELTILELFELKEL